MKLNIEDLRFPEIPEKLTEIADPKNLEVLQFLPLFASDIYLYNFMKLRENKEEMQETLDFIESLIKLNEQKKLRKMDYELNPLYIKSVKENIKPSVEEFLSTIEETNKISPELKPYIAYYITSLSKIRRLGII